MNGIRWTSKDDQVIRELHGTMPIDAIAERLGRSYSSVQTRAIRLGLAVRRYWSEADEQRLREAWGKVKTRDLAAELGRNMNALKQHAIILGLSAERCYTDEEIAKVREMYATHTAADIAEVLHGNRRCALAVFRMAQKLGLRKWPSWAPEILDQVRQLHAAGKCIREIAAEVQLQYNQVKHIQRRLKLPTIADVDARRRSIEGQKKTLGINSGGELRQQAFRKYARSFGWPEDLRVRAVQMLEVLFAGGPMTRRQICAALGMPWKGPRKSLVSNDVQGTYLAELMNRGLVERSAGRVVKGDRKGSSCHLYYLTPLAEEMKNGWQETAGAESGLGDQGLADRA